MSNETDELTGHCACGALRYRVSEAPVLVEYCHCESCRRAVGAPLMAWAAFRRGAFEWLDGEATQEAEENTFLNVLLREIDAEVNKRIEQIPVY